MSKRTRSRTGVEAKRRRARIGRRLKARRVRRIEAAIAGVQRSLDERAQEALSLVRSSVRAERVALVRDLFEAERVRFPQGLAPIGLGDLVVLGDDGKVRAATRHRTIDVDVVDALDRRDRRLT